MIRIDRVDYATGKALCMHMLPMHYDELTQNKELMSINPDDALYSAIEKNGDLIVLVMFSDSVVIGYSVNMLTHSMHYVGTRICKNDLFFIHPDYRHGRNGLRLINETKRIGKESGGQLMMWHAKQYTPMAAMLERLGCAVQEITYSEVM